MSLQLAAQHMASRGRGPDTQLVHMTPKEVSGLHALARAGGGSLTINPETGLVEAGILERLLPTLLGVGLSFIPGVGPLMAAGIVGGGTTLATGSLQKGIVAGLGAYGGAGLGAGLGAAAEAGTAATGLTSAGGVAGANPMTVSPMTFGADTAVNAAGSAATDVAANAAGTAATDTVAQGVSTPIQDGFARAGRGFDALATPEGRSAFMGNAASKGVEASGVGGGSGLLKSTYSAAVPMMQPEPYQKPPEDTEQYTYDYNANQAEDPNAGYTGAYTGERTYFRPTFTRTNAAGGGLMDLGTVQAMSDNNMAETMMANGGQRFNTGGLSNEQLQSVQDFLKTNPSAEALAKAQTDFGVSNDGLAAARAYSPFQIGPGPTQIGPGPDTNYQPEGFEGSRVYTPEQRIGINKAFIRSQEDAGYGIKGLMDDMTTYGITANDLALSRGLDKNTVNQYLTRGGADSSFAGIDENYDIAAQDKFIANQNAMANPYGQGTLGDAYKAQGISDTDPRRRAQAQAMVERAANRAAMRSGFSLSGGVEQTVVGPGNTQPYVPPSLTGTAPTVITTPPTTPAPPVTSVYQPTPTPPGTAPSGPPPLVNIPPGTAPSGPPPLVNIPSAPQQPIYRSPTAPAVTPVPTPAQSMTGESFDAFEYLSGRKQFVAPTAATTYNTPTIPAADRVGENFENFDYAAYLKANPGVQDELDRGVANFGDKSNLAAAAYNHYVMYGKGEGRKYIMLTDKIPESRQEYNDDYKLIYDPVLKQYTRGALKQGRTGSGVVATEPLQNHPDTAKNGGLMAQGGLSALSMAQGGYNLGDYSDGGRLLRGPGNGVSDSIPASIGGKRPARLADGEFVIPARIVSELGNGSTEAGARQLYAMMDRVQNARKKSIGKKAVAVDSRSEKMLPA